MKTNHIMYLILALSLLASCKVKKATESAKSIQELQVPVREHSMQSVLWQQQAAEYRALTYQAYNIAKLRLDQALDSPQDTEKSLAIITDLDETVIDNSPYNAKMIEQDVEYTREGWIDWGKQEQATAIPGAVDFFNYADSKGVKIYYVSNRYDAQKPETMSNLRALGLPQIEESQFLLRTTSSGKEERRQSIESNATILLLLGDNLTDFSDAFENKSTEERAQLTDDMQAQFGSRFIVFPNPMYGDWETKGLYQGSYKWTAQQKDSLRRAALRSY